VLCWPEAGASRSRKFVEERGARAGAPATALAFPPGVALRFAV
jgi:hypothetical protein